MDWSQYILIGFIFACLFFLGASAVLFWAHKHGQLSDLEKGARSIFDDDEPMGEVSDQFPEKRKGKKRK